jgi:hypothetical protein
MKFNTLLKYGIIFLLGFLSANLIGFYAYGLEMPLLKDFGFNSSYSQTPSDYISESQIQVYKDKIVIKVPEASISSYASTGSMIPVLNENSNGIRIVPESEDEVGVGDIITFEEGNVFIVHRVIEKGIDNEGVYFITKGDNNNVSDGKIRFKNIKYKTIAIIY